MKVNSDLASNDCCLPQGARVQFLNFRLSQYGLGSFFLFTTFFSIAFASVLYFGFLRGLAASLIVDTVTLVALRKWKAIGLIGAIHVILGGASLTVSVFDMLRGRHYAQWYNSRLEKLAVRNELLGIDETKVRAILGAPTLTTTGWSVTDSRTGEPGINAQYVTTYYYAPYPFLPIVDVFHVYCVDGKVASFEASDD